MARSSSTDDHAKQIISSARRQLRILAVSRLVHVTIFIFNQGRDHCSLWNYVVDIVATTGVNSAGRAAINQRPAATIGLLPSSSTVPAASALNQPLPKLFPYTSLPKGKISKRPPPTRSTERIGHFSCGFHWSVKGNTSTSFLIFRFHNIRSHVNKNQNGGRHTGCKGDYKSQSAITNALHTEFL